MIAILSDTHMPRGDRQLPAGAVAVLERAEAIVHGGDLCALSVLEYLRTFAPVHAIHGNVDEPDLRRLLPAALDAQVGPVRIGAVHDPGPATGRHDRLVAAFPECDVVVYGHTHLPEVVDHRGTWIVNPGSPTKRRRAPGHTMAVVRDGQPSLIDL